MPTQTNLNNIFELKELIDTLSSRHMHLLEKATLTEQDAAEMNSRTISLKKDIKLELDIIHSGISDLKDLVERAEKVKKSISSDFKSIAKQDSFIKLNRRVEKLKYEEFMSRKELDSLFE